MAVRVKWLSFNNQKKGSNFKQFFLQKSSKLKKILINLIKNCKFHFLFAEICQTFPKALIDAVRSLENGKSLKVGKYI